VTRGPQRCVGVVRLPFLAEVKFLPPGPLVLDVGQVQQTRRRIPRQVRQIGAGSVRKRISKRRSWRTTGSTGFRCVAREPPINTADMAFRSVAWGASSPLWTCARLLRRRLVSPAAQAATSHMTRYPDDSHLKRHDQCGRGSGLSGACAPPVEATIHYVKSFWTIVDCDADRLEEVPWRQCCCCPRPPAGRREGCDRDLRGFLWPRLALRRSSGSSCA